MALGAGAQYFVRKNGSDSLNGGGFDPTISGAGTNYCDQDAVQLALTDLACADSTTVTSVTGGFTSAMVGNAIRITGGTNFIKAYYYITAYTDTNTVTVDRKPVTGGTTGSAGTGKIGGAHATLKNFSTVQGGSPGLPAPDSGVAVPLVPGNTVFIRSNGSSADPSISTPDYDFSAGYWQIPDGNYTAGAGPIRIIGLGASESLPTVATNYRSAYRPCIKISGLWIVNGNAVHMFNIKSFHTTSPQYTTYGVMTQVASSAQVAAIFNCIHDMNGQAASFSGSNNLSVSIVVGNFIKNTGTTTGGQTQAALFCGYGYPTLCLDNVVTDVRGPGIERDFTATYGSGVIAGNIVKNAGSDAFKLGTPLTYDGIIANNTAYNPAGHGFSITQGTLARHIIINNTASKISSGKYAYNVTSGTAADNDKLKLFFDYNNAYLDGGAGGLYNGISAGPHDLNVDPQFTNPTNNDFSIGTNLKDKSSGFSGLGPLIGSLSHMDIGAVQRAERSPRANFSIGI